MYVNELVEEIIRSTRPQGAENFAEDEQAQPATEGQGEEETEDVVIAAMKDWSRKKSHEMAALMQRHYDSLNHADQEALLMSVP